MFRFRSDMPERFPLPWSIKPHEESWEVRDATDFPIAYVYFAGRSVVGTNPDRLTREQARRIAANIARLPELLVTRG
jgi:hypothetical protein